MERKEEIKVILRNRNAFTFFMGWLKVTRPDISMDQLIEYIRWYISESRHGTRPIGIKTETNFLDFMLFVISARDQRVMIFCEGDRFALEG